MDFNIKDAVFTFALADKPLDMYENHIELSWDGMLLSYTEKTNCLIEKDGNKEIIVIGLCVDALSEFERIDIPKAILENGNDISAALEFCSRLAGNYVIILKNVNGIYAFNDSIGAMQINYVFRDGKCFLSSNEALLARALDVPCCEYSMEINEQASVKGYQLPYDKTYYRGIKILLPNHYLKLDNGNVHRYYPIDRKRNKLDKDLIVDRTISYINGIIREYKKHYGLVGALTGGYDSRVVFSFLNQFPDTEYYTYLNDRLGDDHWDVLVPKIIAERNHLGDRYRLLKHSRMPRAYYDELKNYAGPTVTELRAQLAYTFRKTFNENQAGVNGNVFEELGRNRIGRNMPDSCATASLLMSASYNNSDYAKELFKKQIKEIRREGYGNKLLDIVSWESMCGRWISDSMTVYSVAGCNMLNICNCRKVLDLWLKMNKQERHEASLHKGILKTLDAGLLDYPFNPGRKRLNRIQKNWVYRLIVSDRKLRRLLGKR